MSMIVDWRSEAMCINADHPALPGHFPGRPVVPGVVLLDCLREALCGPYPHWRLTGLPSVKFASPLLPEQGFCILLQGELPKPRFRIERDTGELLAQGQLLLEAIEVAAE